MIYSACTPVLDMHVLDRLLAVGQSLSTAAGLVLTSLKQTTQLCAGIMKKIFGELHHSVFFSKEKGKREKILS